MTPRAVSRSTDCPVGSVAVRALDRRSRSTNLPSPRLESRHAGQPARRARARRPKPSRRITGRSTSAPSTRPRTPRCGWCWSSTANGSSRRRPHIGYLHSGFEKLGEHLNFNQYVTVADRKNYISPPLNEVAWHHAVEKLLDVELTPRCQYIRVIIGELARISDHLLCTGRRGARPRGVHRVPLRLQPPRADLRRLRGDVGLPVPPRLHPGRRRALRLQRQGPRAGSGAFMDRLPRSSIGHGEAAVPQPDLPRPDAGRRRAEKDERSPLLHRADRPGQRRDLRPPQGRSRTWPIPSFDFRSPTRPRGTATPGSMVRMEEMDQSHRIIRAGPREPPAGPVNVPIAEKFPLPDKADGLQQHGGPDPALRADHAQPRPRDARSTRSTRRSRAPTASWATTSSPTAPSSPGGPGPGRPRSSTSRSSRISSRTTCSPTWWRCSAA